MARFLMCIEYTINYPDGLDGHVFKSVQIQFKDDEILVIMKKDTPKGPMVSFTSANSFIWALYNVHRGLITRKMRWMPDKWAKR